MHHELIYFLGTSREKPTFFAWRYLVQAPLALIRRSLVFHVKHCRPLRGHRTTKPYHDTSLWPCGQDGPATRGRFQFPARGRSSLRLGANEVMEALGSQARMLACSSAGIDQGGTETASHHTSISPEAPSPCDKTPEHQTSWCLKRLVHPSLVFSPQQTFTVPQFRNSAARISRRAPVRIF